MHSHIAIVGQTASQSSENAGGFILLPGCLEFHDVHSVIIP